MDLHARTQAVLDWEVVLTAFVSRARTPMGKRACLALLPRARASEIRADHDAIDELTRYEQEEGPLPVGAVGDIEEFVGQAVRGLVLDGPTLRSCAHSLMALRELATRLQEAADEAPTLAGMGASIEVDAWIADALNRSFDASGQLSAAEYPELGDLRKQIADLHETIRRTLENLVHGDTLADVLQDRFVTQRGERYVLPIKSHAKRWDIGIVHGTSASGKTAFIEPNEVITLNNRLKIAEGELEAAEHRILTMLSGMLGRIAPAVLLGLEATTELDLVCARQSLSQALGAKRPVVGEEGVITLKGARHPVLLLRGVAVVANDLALAAGKPVLVLTGPNTGGKTVALKTIGLCALLVRLGCFIPAEEGSRIDRFDAVLADIGDTQAISADLSSFSGHLVALREMLATAAPGRLFLLDELCSGTDPAQGGALARAVLEALIERGPRVVVTTHFAQLKGLATVDDRYALAAMEYANGRPTYRVVHDATGESHALDTALRMGIAPELVERARGLMSESERGLQDALSALEVERYRAATAVREGQRIQQSLSERERSVAAREEELKKRSKELEQREAARFLDRLKAAEKAISAVVADLQRAPDHRKVESARATLNALKDLVPALPVSAPAELAVGDRVRVRSSGSVGQIVSIGSTIRVKIGAITVKARPEDLEIADTPVTQAVQVPKVQFSPRERPPELGEALRIQGNTLDLRGQRVEEAFDAVDLFIDRLIVRGQRVGFLLHGHGTGALKDALRQWLGSHPRVWDWAPANADQGGDAYTVIGSR